MVINIRVNLRVAGLRVKEPIFIKMGVSTLVSFIKGLRTGLVNLSIPTQPGTKEILKTIIFTGVESISLKMAVSTWVTLKMGCLMARVS